MHTLTAQSCYQLIISFFFFLGSAEIQVKEPSDLNQYVSYDPTEEKYFCQICQKFTFRSRYNVRNHVEAVHFPNVFSYSCDFCEKAVGSKNALSIHMTRMHKNWTCFLYHNKKNKKKDFRTSCIPFFTIYLSARTAAASMLVSTIFVLLSYLLFSLVQASSPMSKFWAKAEV